MMKKMIFAPFVAAAFIGLAGFVVMELWNWLMPEIFGLGMINFWQALGLIILSKIFFGGFGWRGGSCGGYCGPGYRHGGHYWKHKFKHKWANMSEEEKERWKTKFGDKCSPYNETRKTKTSSGDEGITVESASSDASEASDGDESSSEGDDGYSK